LDFKPEDLDQWIVVLANMKNHLLISLCYKDFSASTIRILKKFFFNYDLQERMINECLEIFISMLRLLYQPDTESECKENVHDFLEELHDGSDECIGTDTQCNSTDELRSFVYESIKAFAEANQKAYKDSNLVELMNKVVAQKRGPIFPQVKKPSQVAAAFMKNWQSSRKVDLKNGLDEARAEEYESE
jgi:hypothetical protein